MVKAAVHAGLAGAGDVGAEPVDTVKKGRPVWAALFVFAN